MPRSSRIRFGRRRGRLVRALDHDFAVDRLGICLFGDHAAKGGRHQPFAGDRPELVIRNAFAVFPLGNRFSLGDVGQESGISSPLSLYIPPDTSLTATTVAPLHY